VFWPLLSNTKRSGVPEDSKSSTLGVGVSSSHFTQSRVATQLNEIQIHHWHNFQITILVHLTWRINHNFSVGDDEKTKMITKYHFYISNDYTHDNLFVQHCFKWHWTWLQAWNIKLPTEHTIWSDGCAF
jgi:hypothetical protein